MKRTRKGFTLVELLIVVAIVGVLATMMTMSSTEAVDSAGANTIIENLQALKLAAYQMYMYKPETAKLTIEFQKSDGNKITEDGTETVEGVLGSYLGKKADILVAKTGNTPKYGLAGDKDAWYVVYQPDTEDSAGVKAKLKAGAKKAELLGAASANFAIADYYNGEAYIGLQVR